MATVDILPEYGGPMQGMSASFTTGKKKDRRASVILDDTKEMLHGLYEDHHRSRALMAELEYLLASSQSMHTTSEPYAQAPLGEASTALAAEATDVAAAANADTSEPATMGSLGAATLAEASLAAAAASASQSAQKDSALGRSRAAAAAPKASASAAARNGGLGAAVVASSPAARRKSDTSTLLQRASHDVNAPAFTTANFVSVQAAEDETAEEANALPSGPTSLSPAARRRRSSVLNMNSSLIFAGAGAGGPNPPPGGSNPGNATGHGSHSGPAPFMASVALPTQAGLRGASFMRPRGGLPAQQLQPLSGKSFTEGTTAASLRNTGGAGGGGGGGYYAPRRSGSRSLALEAAAGGSAPGGLPASQQQQAPVLGSMGGGGAGSGADYYNNTGLPAPTAAGTFPAMSPAPPGLAPAPPPTAAPPPLAPPLLRGAAVAVAGGTGNPEVLEPAQQPAAGRRPSLRSYGSSGVVGVSPLGPPLQLGAPAGGGLGPGGILSGGQQRWEEPQEGWYGAPEEAGAGGRPLATPPSGPRSGRFMRMLKGIFQDSTKGSSSQLDAAPSPFRPGPPSSEAPWEGISPGTAPPVGALSAMTLVAPSGNSFSAGYPPPAARVMSLQASSTAASGSASISVAAALASVNASLRSVGGGTGGTGGASGSGGMGSGGSVGYLVMSEARARRASSGPAPRVLVRSSSSLGLAGMWPQPPGGQAAAYGGGSGVGLGGSGSGGNSSSGMGVSVSGASFTHNGGGSRRFLYNTYS